MIDKAKSKGKIERWACCAIGPNLEEIANAPLRVCGRFEVAPGNWKDIVTSSIVDADGVFVETRTGSVYELGEIDPIYLEELAKNGRTYDPANPISFVDSRPPWSAREIVDRKTLN